MLASVENRDDVFCFEETILLLSNHLKVLFYRTFFLLIKIVIQ